MLPLVAATALVLSAAPAPEPAGAFGGKTVFKGFVTITGGAEIWGKAADNKFTIYNTQARVLPQAPPVQVAQASGVTTQTTTTTISGGGPAPAGGVSLGMSFTDPETGEQVNMGVSAVRHETRSRACRPCLPTLSAASEGTWAFA